MTKDQLVNAKKILAQSETELEYYITDDGFLSMRQKTPEGCPRFKEFQRAYWAAYDLAIIKAFEADNAS